MYLRCCITVVDWVRLGFGNTTYFESRKMKRALIPMIRSHSSSGVSCIIVGGEAMPALFIIRLYISFWDLEGDQTIPCAARPTCPVVRRIRQSYRPMLAHPYQHSHQPRRQLMYPYLHPLKDLKSRSPSFMINLLAGTGCNLCTDNIGAFADRQVQWHGQYRMRSLWR